MKISKKIKNIMRVSAILALLVGVETGMVFQPTAFAAGYPNSQNSGYGEGNPSQNADFGPYMKRMQDKIKSKWNPPAQDRDAQIVVKYRILRDGTLDSYGILSSSGLQALDSAAIAALQSASPFEPLPASFNRDSILVQFTFDYQKPNNAVSQVSKEPVNMQSSAYSQAEPVTRKLANLQQPAKPTVSSQTIPANRQIINSPQNIGRSNQIADFQPLVPVNVRTATQPVSMAGTPAAPIRIKAAPGESIQVEKLPPQAGQKIFPPVRAVQTYEQTPATLAGSQQTIHKYVQAPEVANQPEKVTQVYVPAPPPPEILEPIQPPRAIVPLPPKNTDPRTVAVPPPIRQTPAVDITTYAQGELLDLDGSKMAKSGQGQVSANSQPSYVFVPAQTPMNTYEINRVVPPNSYPEVEYIKFEEPVEQPALLTTGINKVDIPTHRKKLTRPVKEEQYADIPEHKVVPAPVPKKEYVAPVRVADLSAYMRKVERRITRNWHPPLSDYSTKVVVNYIIHRDGELGKYSVVESSGNSRMDASAEEALKKAAPFPSLPKDYDKDTLEVKFTFDYNVYKNKSERRGIKELEDGDL